MLGNPCALYQVYGIKREKLEAMAKRKSQEHNSPPPMHLNGSIFGICHLFFFNPPLCQIHTKRCHIKKAVTFWWKGRIRSTLYSSSLKSDTAWISTSEFFPLKFGHCDIGWLTDEPVCNHKWSAGGRIPSIRSYCFRSDISSRSNISSFVSSRNQVLNPNNVI